MPSEYVEIVVPQQGLTVEDVTVTKWLKCVGDTVSRGEPVVEILSDKANLEVESPASGILADVLVQVDQEAAIGAVLGRIEKDGSE
ncbi:MAG: hypothetical protein HYX78_05985 [Armatimonadetes bacterium]|nr:hypothetical protein [Armatimonadota bacterium]